MELKKKNWGELLQLRYNTKTVSSSHLGGRCKWFQNVQCILSAAGKTAGALSPAVFCKNISLFWEVLGRSLKWGKIHSHDLTADSHAVNRRQEKGILSGKCQQTCFFVLEHMGLRWHTVQWGALATDMLPQAHHFVGCDLYLAGSSTVCCHTVVWAGMLPSDRWPSVKMVPAEELWWPEPSHEDVSGV